MLTMWMRRYIYKKADATVNYASCAYDILPSYGVKREDIFVRYNTSDTDTLFEHKLMVQIINELFPELQAVTSGELWIDIYHKDGGKGSAIQYLQHKYGISSEESMAFGDSLNDETMLKAVEYSIAMGNADPDLVAFCQYQIGTNEEQAVLDVLEQLTSETNLAFMQQYKIIR